MDTAITPQLAAFLAMRFKALDEVRRIRRITPKVQVMLDAFARLKREQTEAVAQAVYLQAVIKARQAELTNLVERFGAGEKISNVEARALNLQLDIRKAYWLLSELDSGITP